MKKLFSLIGKVIHDILFRIESDMNWSERSDYPLKPTRLSAAEVAELKAKGIL